MSTNYFILTKNKELLTTYGLNAEVTDTPDWGYWVHILQLCPGCVPLFQAHKNVRSLPDVFALLQEPTVLIYDEYYRLVEETHEAFCNKLQEICNNPENKSRNWDNYTWANANYYKDRYGNEFFEGDFR